MQHIPNSFQVPNYAIDVVMAKVSPAAFKCYIAVMRKTTGWQKESDRISLSQLSELIGMSARQIQRAMKELEHMELIKREKSPDNWTKYSLDTGSCSDANVTTLVTNMSPPSDTDGTTPSDTDGAQQNPTNTKPTKQNNNAHLDDSAAYEFGRFWDMYGKKKDIKRCESIWKQLKKSDKEKIFEVLPAYVASTPDLQYRKHPKTWLGGECWNDEIEVKSSHQSVNYKNPSQGNDDYYKDQTL